MSKDTNTPQAIPTATDATPASRPDELVYYCATDGTVKPVKRRELERVEHGGVTFRRCKQCEGETPHAVLYRSDLADPATVIEALTRCLNAQGVIVRRSPRDHGTYGLQLNRYDPRRADGTEGRREGQEALLCGPITVDDVASLLRDANWYAAAGSDSFDCTAFRGTKGVWIPAPSGGGEQSKRSFMAVYWLYGAYGHPAEVGEEPYPPLRQYAETLRDLLSVSEREAVALVLTRRESELSVQHNAFLDRPCGLNGRGRTTGGGSSMSRREIPDVTW